MKIPERIDIKPTAKLCNRWFTTLNKVIWCGELPPVDQFIIRDKPVSSTWANYLDYGDPKYVNDIEIVAGCFPTLRFFVSVLGHEMVHHWQWANGLKVCHDKNFYSFRAKFEENGLILSRAM